MWILLLVINLLTTSCQDAETQIDFGLPNATAESYQWSEQEINMVYEINQYRHSLNKSLLEMHESSKVLSWQRVEFWILNDNGSTKDLHIYWAGISKQHEEQKILIGATELASYGMYDILGAFKKSDSHNKALLGNYKYIGITIKRDSENKQYCCIVLGL